MNTILNEIDEDVTLLLDNLPVGIMKLNEARICVYANNFFQHWLGTNALEDVVGEFCSSVHKDDVNNERKACDMFFETGEETETVFRLYNKITCEYRWIKNKRRVISPRTDMPSATATYLYAFQDIHDTKTLEIKFRQESQRAEQALNHKTLFLANMSHEIRTPLNGIIGMLTLLEDTQISSEQMDYISMVKECSFNLMTIINDILDFSKLEVGKISLDFKPTCIQDCIESTNDIIVAKIYERSLEYTYNISPDVPEYLDLDGNRLKQILLNLLSNSAKYTERGTIFLNVEQLVFQDFCLLSRLYGGKSEIVEDCERNVYLKFDVTDTGCGIDDDQRNRLFQSFSQIDNGYKASTKIYQGTGLGLAISKDLVELMGGCIWLDWSEPNVGSRFSFIIKTSHSDYTYTSIDETSEMILRDTNVLILDDNLFNRLSLTGMVTKWGMKAHAFSNAEEALYFSKLTRFDIGLIDICMPKLNGAAFAQKLREQKEFNNKTFPLIALSSVGEKVSSISKHFNAHLMKPIKETKLKTMCINALQMYFNTLGDNVKVNTSWSGNGKNSMILDNYLDTNNLGDIRENIRVLLAEDVYINQRVIVSFLEKLGFKDITVVENGKQCLERLDQRDFDIVLLDIRMPILSGEEVLVKVNEMYQNESERKRTKPYIVAVTAYSMKEDREKYLNLGFDDYVPKPVTLLELKKCVNTFLKQLLQQ